jgi:hypothetical protein
VRAFTGAEIYLARRVPSLAAAAVRCGSNVGYIKAAIVLLQDEPALHSQQTRESVLAGRVPLLAAAREVRKRQKAGRVTVEEMTATWRAWPPALRATFGREVGISEIWDFAIAPVISEGRGKRVHTIAAE